MTTRVQRRKERPKTPHEFQAWIVDETQSYITDFLGQQTWDKQVEIVHSVLVNRRTAVRGCIGSSKTFAAALAVFAFIHHFGPGSEIYTTAPTFRQVKKAMWKEIRKIHKRAPVELGGKLLETEWKMDDDWFAMGFSAKDPDSAQSLHAKHILLVIDETQGISQDTMEALENIMAGGNSRLLLLCNPSTTSGEAFDAFASKAKIYERISIPYDKTPNVVAGKTVIAGMIEKAQAEEWIDVWGWDSNFVRVKLRAIPPRQEDDTVIPIEWVELAMEREASSGRKVLGVDVARFGNDLSVIAPLDGRQFGELEIHSKRDTMHVAGAVKNKAEDFKAEDTGVDVIGLGAGPYDRLQEEKVSSTPVNVSEAASDPDEFPNLRSELWFKFKEALDPRGPDPIGLPKDPELMAELVEVRYRLDGKGRKHVESKDELKKRLKKKGGRGRSPDRADAVMIALHVAECGEPIPGATAEPAGEMGGRVGLRRLSDRGMGSAFKRLRAG